MIKIDLHSGRSHVWFPWKVHCIEIFIQSLFSRRYINFQVSCDFPVDANSSCRDNWQQCFIKRNRTTSQTWPLKPFELHPRTIGTVLIIPPVNSLVILGGMVHITVTSLPWPFKFHYVSNFYHFFLFLPFLFVGVVLSEWYSLLLQVGHNCFC